MILGMLNEGQTSSQAYLFSISFLVQVHNLPAPCISKIIEKNLENYFIEESRDSRL